MRSYIRNSNACSLAFYSLSTLLVARIIPLGLTVLPAIDHTLVGSLSRRPSRHPHSLNILGQGTILLGHAEAEMLEVSTGEDDVVCNAGEENGENIEDVETDSLAGHCRTMNKTHYHSSVCTTPPLPSANSTMRKHERIWRVSSSE